MSLPERVALDASFIVDVCKDVAEAKQALMKLKEARCKLLVPIPVWAEIARGVRHGGISRMAKVGAAPLTLDSVGAEFLGVALATEGTECGCGKLAWSFDAMIFACAVAGKCDLLVTGNLRHYEPFEQATGSGLVIANAARLIRMATPPPPASLPTTDPPKPVPPQRTLFDLMNQDESEEEDSFDEP